MYMLMRAMPAFFCFRDHPVQIALNGVKKGKTGKFGGFCAKKPFVTQMLRVDLEIYQIIRGVFASKPLKVEEIFSKIASSGVRWWIAERRDARYGQSDVFRIV
ncbi:MAG: hypothetical protein IKU34_06500 [Clostridia bacterium]|nr:hypothetical protein [Clostridia bacterium]